MTDQSTTKTRPKPAGPWSMVERGSRVLGDVLPRLLFTTPYLLLIMWFHAVDVYNSHFSDIGITIFIYNCCRVLFIFYLFWIIETPGLTLLRILAPNTIADIGCLERLTLGFFTGASLWHLVLLALGYLDLYTVPIAIGITAPVVAAAVTDARAAYCEIKRSVTSDNALTRHFGAGILGWLAVAVAVVVLALLLLIKGLYPGGGHDYYTHYFYYFMTVVKNHGIWPNNVWYHYYYDKGAGLYFLGILLSDPLAPQLVTFTFFATAVLALYLALYRVAAGTLWPVAGVVQFISIYIYTPGSAALYRANGGWGEFEKTHEIIAALVVAVFWMTTEALSSAGQLRRLWIIGGAATIVAAILANVTIAAFFGGLFVLLALYYLVRRDLERFIVCFWFGAAAVLPAVATLILNQWTTGLADDQGVLFFWRFANVAKLAQWGALPLVMELVHDRQAMVTAGLPLASIATVMFIVRSFRLDLVAPMLMGGLAVAAPSLLRGRWNRALTTQIAVIVAAMFTFVIIALAAGRSQEISYYRYATFATALAIVCGILCWNLASTDSLIAKFTRNPAIAIVVLFVCSMAYVYPHLTARAAVRAIRFAVGAYSIDTAYQNEVGRPSTGIYTGARGAYETVGPGVPIWSLFSGAYCMLPDCLIEEHHAFIVSDWNSVINGTPEQAKTALQIANVNYFLFSREAAVTDALSRSRLFSPNNIGRYLGIRWTDGTNALLTWLGPGVKPLNQEWIEAYRSAIGR